MKSKPKWSLLELKRFDRILLQISLYDVYLDAYDIVGTITIDETDLESREEWMKAIDVMNLEHSQKNS